jgi:hypothetical protein
MANPIGTLFHHIQSELSDDGRSLNLWIKGKHFPLSADECRQLGRHLLERAHAMEANNPPKASEVITPVGTLPLKHV